MSRDAYRRGYMISLCESQEEDEFVSQILSRQFDGLFVSASGVTDRELELLVKSGIPMVLFLNREINCELQDTFWWTRDFMKAAGSVSDICQKMDAEILFILINWENLVTGIFI
mgnify:CR=1 FL=1